MTSSQIKQNLELSKQRISDTEAQLRISTDLDEGLKLQSELNNLEKFQNRLETQLESALSQEIIAKKELDNAALDAQLADLEAKNHILLAEMQDAVRAVAPQLQELLDKLKPLHSERLKLNVQHEQLHMKRYNSYPKKYLVEGRSLLSPEALNETEQGTLFAVELINAAQTGNGPTYQDVLRALSFKSQVLGF